MNNLLNTLTAIALAAGILINSMQLLEVNKRLKVVENFLQRLSTTIK